MGRKFEDVVDMLDYEELMKFKKDIDQGAVTVKRLLEFKIKKKLKEHDKICAVCYSELNFYAVNNYTLVFGPDDFKKKASFCGLDCLGHFVMQLRSLKQSERKVNQENA
ncbi:MAG TPA: hypothetical protein VI564_01230 [Candidatus Nanoarchaeia archaeon]|nr:hypothetical protein [Candidatus Nanoarchaeia archaeon]